MATKKKSEKIEDSVVVLQYPDSEDFKNILAEIEEVKAQLPGLKKNDREAFSQLHERYLYLLQERDRLMGKTYG